MSGKLSLMQIKAELDIRQQKAAQLLVENEHRTKADGGRRTLDEIGEEMQISRQTLWAWQKQPAFRAFMQHLADEQLDARRAFVDGQLFKLIEGVSNNGVASIKALEMYYKLNGRLVERSIVETVDGSKPQLTDAEISAGIAELADKLKGSD